MWGFLQLITSTSKLVLVSCLFFNSVRKKMSGDGTSQGGNHFNSTVTT